MSSVPQRFTLLGSVALALILTLATAGCSNPEPIPVNPAVKQPLESQPSANTAENKVELEIVAENLDNPCGVAVQPETGHLFVSVNQRVIRLVPGESYSSFDEITGFPTDSYGKGPKYDIGPLGLAFLNNTTLVVGGGGNLDGAEIVSAFTVQADAPAAAAKPDTAVFSGGPIAPGEDSKMGEGNFYGIAIQGSTIFVTCNGDDTKGWISKLEIDGTESTLLTPFIKSKVLTGVDAPAGATITPDSELLVSQLGEINEHPDSLLTFYDPATGDLKQKLETGLRELTAVAYSPKTGKLYGLDFSWAKPAEAGLFRLEISGDTVQATRLADLDKPTALAFAPDGTLYITAIGTAGDAVDSKPGKVLMAHGL